jgi:hypothetical protein
MPGMSDQPAENQEVQIAALTPVTEPLKAVEPKIVESKVTATIAPRPHWITIGLGLVSPLLAVLALVMSIKSLNTSKDSLRIGQRAYLRADANLYQEPNHPDIWTVGVVFKNTGNTPGALISSTAKSTDLDGCTGSPAYVFDRFVSDWKFGLENRLIGDGSSAGDYLKTRTSRLSCVVTEPSKLVELTSVGGKDSAIINLVSFYVPALWHGRNFNYIPLPNLKVEFTYRDVFGEDHHGSGSCKFDYDAGVVMSSCTDGD